MVPTARHHAPPPECKTRCVESAADVLRRKPTTGIDGCCARALRSAQFDEASQQVGVDVKHRLPNSGIFEIAVNASLAFIEGAKPRDEIECVLVIQMACTHSAAMVVVNRLGGAAGDRTVAAIRGGTIAARLRNPGRGFAAPEKWWLPTRPRQACERGRAIGNGTAGKEHPSSRMSNEIDDDRDELVSRMTQSEILAQVEAQFVRERSLKRGQLASISKWNPEKDQIVCRRVMRAFEVGEHPDDAKVVEREPGPS